MPLFGNSANQSSSFSTLTISGAGSSLSPSLSLYNLNAKDSGFYRESFNSTEQEKFYALVSRIEVATFTKNGIGINVPSPSAQLHIKSNSPTTKVAILQGAVNQESNFLDLQNSSGVAIASFNNVGDLAIGSVLKLRATDGNTQVNKIVFAFDNFSPSAWPELSASATTGIGMSSANIGGTLQFTNSYIRNFATNSLSIGATNGATTQVTIENQSGGQVCDLRVTGKIICDGRLSFNSSDTAPVNTASPTAWLNINVSGSVYKLPLYQ